MRSLNIVLAITISLVLLLSIEPSGATRVLRTEMKRQNLVMQSLQKGPVRPPGNPCTGTPKGDGNTCPKNVTIGSTINETGFVGHVNAAPPPPTQLSTHGSA